MELRVLRYFLALAREESITRASEVLHVTQPTLSRQLSELEDEIGKKLFFRGSRKTTLTDDGIILRKRAQEIVDLVDSTMKELSSFGADISGVISIGADESDAMRLIARSVKKMREGYPRVRYRLYSGNGVLDLLERNVIDFGFTIGAVDIVRYDCLRFPDVYLWGLLMRNDSDCSTVNPEALLTMPLLYPRFALIHNELSGWLGYDFEKLNIVATYNLIHNAGLLVEEGIGYAVCLSKLSDKTPLDNLCFKPLEPHIQAHLYLVWKKNHVFSKAAEIFLQVIQKITQI